MSAEEEIIDVDKSLEEAEDSAETSKDDETMSDLSQTESRDSISMKNVNEESTPENPSSGEDLQNETEKLSEELQMSKKIEENKGTRDKDASSDVVSIKKFDKILPKPPSNLIPKDGATFSMKLSKEDIERMISDGSLEKVSEGYYKVKPDSLKDIKISSSHPSKNTITMANLDQGKSIVQPLSMSSVSTLQHIPNPEVVPQPSFVALMPVNTVAGTGASTAFVALPLQQSSTVAYNTSLPAFVTLTQSGVPPVTSNLPQIETQVASTTSISGDIDKINVEEAQVIMQPEQTSAEVQRTSSPLLSTTQSKVDKEIATSAATRIPKTSIGTSTTGVKRKPQFGNTKIKKPYRFAKPLRKRRKTTKLKDFVSDQNSSDEEDEIGLCKPKSHTTELASMFFKKIGEPNATNKSLLDKLHKAIFNDSNMDSEEEEESEDSDLDEVISDIKSGKAKYQTINCPGPNQYEALIGPANNSKLSIIRCQETKQVKNFLYEIYKVRVTSAGREANTNILIPIPEGYKFEIPTKAKEEEVEFSHIPHEDPEGSNHVNPLFLEKLAETELKLRKCKDEVKVLRGRYMELLQEYANRPQFSTLSDLVGASAKFLTEDQLVFFLMQLKAGAHNMQGIRYSVREKILALSIYQKSPEVYKWLKKLFNLPPKRTLDQWLEEIGSQDPQLLKKLMYHIYTTYNFKADI